MRRSSFRLVLASGVAVAFALLSPFHLQAQYVYVKIALRHGYPLPR
jgi:hypothetical protein